MTDIEDVQDSTQWLDWYRNVRMPYVIGAARVLPTAEMLRVCAADRFDVFELIAQKPNQVRVDSKCAKRFMRPLLDPFPFDGLVLRASIMATTKKGRRQHTHYDMNPELAAERNIFVYIQNLGLETFTVWIRVEGKDVEVAVPPHAYISFPAETPHAGSGEIHHHRLYVLYSKIALSAAEMSEVHDDSDELVAID